MNNIPHIDKETRKNMEALKEVAERHPEAIQILMTSGGNMTTAMMKQPKKMMALAKDLQATAESKGVDLKALMSQGESFAKSQGIHTNVPSDVEEHTEVMEEPADQNKKTDPSISEKFFSKFKKN